MSILDDILKNPTIMAKLLEFLGRLLGDKKNPTPDKPVTKPINGDPEDEFPDDTFPAPDVTRKVARVEYKLTRGQYNKQRFPEYYTADNPMGLFDHTFLRQVQSGESAAPYGSKLWFDLTAFDAGNKEILRDGVVASGLSYKTEHHIGDAYIIGKGGRPDSPTAGYETNDTDQIGNGNTAWRSSLGFLHQVKAHGEGSFDCYGKVDGVESDHFTLRVS